jgi:hypothetical protein
MRTPWSWVLAASVAGALSACNGPKETCEGSARSFYSLLKGHDWSGLHEMLTPEFRQRWNKVDRFSEAMEAVWLGSKDFSVKWNTIGETRERVCVVNGQLTYTIKIRGQEPRTTSDEYFSWTLRQGTDGRWYAELPGQEKISGY